MAGERIRLEVQEREQRGTARVAAPAQGGPDPRRPLRARDKPHPISVHERELRRVLTGGHGLHAILDVVLDGQKSTHASILKDYQVDPIRGEDRALRPPGGPARPADPVRGRRRARRRVRRHEGRAACSRRSRARSASRRCRWRSRPDRARRQRDGDRRLAAPLRPADPEGVTYLDDPETVLATVTVPTKVEEPEPEEARGGRGGRRGRGCRGRGGAGGRRRGARRGRGARPAASRKPPKGRPVPLFRRGERASTLDLLVAGLGNPGREYAATRHNVGWMVLDELARRHDGSWRSKFSGQLAEVRVDGAKLALAQARDVHERVGPVARRGRAVLQGAGGDGARRPRRRRPRGGAPAGARSAAGWPVTTACARSRSISAPRSSSGCGSASAARAAATAARWPTTCSSPFAPETDAAALVARVGRRGRGDRRATASRPRSSASTERASIGTHSRQPGT